MKTKNNFSRGMALCTMAALFIAASVCSADNKPALPGLTPGQQPGQKPLPNPQNLRVVKPDLTITSIVPGSTPSRPAVITIRNIGDGAAVASNVKFSCTVRYAPSSSSNCQPGTVSAPVSALAPGAEATLTVETGALGKSGRPLVSSMIRACLDSGNVVAESNEANNCANGSW
jgi:hypothetical protein